MIRRRLLVLLAGATLAGTPALLVVLPAAASTTTPLGGMVRGSATQEQARRLLALAAHAATTRTWSGTQYVGTWRGGAQTSAVLDVSHRPGTGSTVHEADGSSAGAVTTPDLDERLLSLVADHYDLALAGVSRCAGRYARVVEARRDGVEGAGRVAGRFWLDAATGLVLRREVYDDAGRRLRSSAFVDLVVAPVTLQPPALKAPREDPATVLPVGSWRPPSALPRGLQLFEAEVEDVAGGRVTHLAYSDGLSTLSVFAQRGALAEVPGAGFHTERVRGTRAWVEPAAPERVVWQGGGQVFTLVSDADPATVRAAVGALPRDPVRADGVLGRLRRGLARVGSWVNPFD